MRSLPPTLRRGLLLLALCGVSATGALADRLHLEGGGRIDVVRWWIEGDTVVYESSGGTVGIPRAIVARIERTDSTGGSHTGTGSPAARGAAKGNDPRDDAELRDMMRRAQQALDDREFELASSYFLRLLEERPEFYAARVGYAVSEMEMQHHGLALSVVLDGISREPDRPELYLLLGELRYRDERLDDALEAYRKAFAIEPGDELRDRILKIERELNASRHYDFASSSHFTLRYDGEVDLALAQSMLDYLEEEYWTVTDAFRHAPEQPITVQLFPLEQFREVTRAPDWAGGLYDGKIRVPLGGLKRLSPDAKRVLVHELTHAVVHSKTRGNAPRWLQEGLAQTLDGGELLRSERASIVETLRSTPVEQWAEIEFSYPVALSMTGFLSDRAGFEGLVRLLDELGRGSDQDEALRAVYGRDYAEVAHAWGNRLLEEAKR